MNIERLRRMKLQVLARKARKARRAELAVKRLARRQKGKKRSRVVVGTSRKVRGNIKRLAVERAAALKSLAAVRAYLVARKRAAAEWDARIAELWVSVVSHQEAMAECVEGSSINPESAPEPSPDALFALEYAIDMVDIEIDTVKEWTS